jgi:uracil-DNA glycosylase family 4
MRVHLRHEQDYCEGCPLYRDKGHRTTYVPTDVYYDRAGADGETPEVDVLFVGETPGDMEDKIGIPFSGPPGAELRNALKKAKIESSYAVGTVVRCRPTDEEGKNRPATTEEIAACSNYIKKDIETLNPRTVVFMGTTAVQALNENPDWSGKKAGGLKGRIFRTKDGKTHLVTAHPSMYIRTENTNEKKRFYRHIGALRRLLTGEETPNSRRGKVKLIRTIEQFDRVMDYYEFECTEPIAFDFETMNLNHVEVNKIATLQLSADNDMAHTIPLQHWESPWTKEELKYVRKRLRRLFRSSETKFKHWLAHNSQFDIGIALRFFRLKRITKPIVDTMFLAFLEDENLASGGNDEDGPKKGGALKGVFSLKQLARERLGFYIYDLELTDALAAREGADGGSLWNLSLDRLSEYGGTDAYVTYRLFNYFVRMLDKQGYESAVPFALRWYSRVSHLLTKMSMAGFYVDPTQLEYLRGDESPILSRLAELPGIIYSKPEAKLANDILLGSDPRTKGMKPLFGKKPWVLDVNKRDHKLHLFIDACKLEPLAVGKDGKGSIDKAFIAHYAPPDKPDEGHPIVRLYSEYSGLFKLRTSYLESVDEILYSKPDNRCDGRIHAGFHANRTVTGRLASSDPNLQQLPRPDNAAKAGIKSMYGASPGHILIEADYGQAEVRWWAQIAGDKEYAALFHRMVKLRKEFLANPSDKTLKERVKLECDIHRQVASLMFQIALSEVTKPMRQRAKSLTFGSIYGQHYKTLAVILGITEDEAEQLQVKFVQQFPKAGNWLTDIENFAETYGRVDTPMGRRRHLAELIERDEKAGKRRARNSPIQAVSSDTTALAAWRIQNWIEENDRPYRVINCVHDAITMEVPLDFDMMVEAQKLMADMMVNIDPFLLEEFGIKMIVPMEVDFKIGIRWGHMLGYDGVESDLRPIYEKIHGWDGELADGMPWHKIVTRDFKDGKGAD